MTVLTVQPYGHFGVFLVSEQEGYLSREQVTLAGGSGKLLDGTVLGRVSIGAISVGAPQAGAENTGEGTITLSTPAYAAGVKLGTWRVEAIAADRLNIVDPDGTVVSAIGGGDAFTGDIKFTTALNAGAFDAGDFWNINVTAAAGTGGYVPYDPSATDGSETASAILLGDYDTGVGPLSAAKEAAVVVRMAEVQAAMLVFVPYTPGVPISGPEIATAKAQLAVTGFAFR